jgi:pimeloyl-ACP methyl ester carboxylesterase
MHDKLPDSELAVLPGAGHSPMVEFPNRFNDLALKFLAVRSGDQEAV